MLLFPQQKRWCINTVVTHGTFGKQSQLLIPCFQRLLLIHWFAYFDKIVVVTICLTKHWQKSFVKRGNSSDQVDWFLVFVAGSCSEIIHEQTDSSWISWTTISCIILWKSEYCIIFMDKRCWNCKLMRGDKYPKNLCFSLGGSKESKLSHKYYLQTW